MLLIIGWSGWGRMVYSKHGYCMGWRFCRLGLACIYTGINDNEAFNILQLNGRDSMLNYNNIIRVSMHPYP
jgi:hypothetical protein